MSSVTSPSRHSPTARHGVHTTSLENSAGTLPAWRGVSLGGAATTRTTDHTAYHYLGTFYDVLRCRRAGLKGSGFEEAGMGRAMQDLDRWLAPFLAAMGHKKRRLWAPLYLRGLLGPSERKSLQPMAASLGLAGHDQLQHFVASPAWDDGAAVARAGRTGRPAGRRAAGGAGDRRHGAAEEGHALGRRGAAVLRPAWQAGELPGAGLADPGRAGGAGARGAAAVPARGVDAAIPERCAAAGVPEEAVDARSKGEIALAELDRLIGPGLRFGVVLADAGYGASAAFRHGLERARPDAGRSASRATRRSMAQTSNWSRPTAASGARCRTRSPARPRRCWLTWRGAR